MKKQRQYLLKMKRKVISLVLIIALLITGLNLDMMSQSTYAAQEKSKESNKTEEKVTIVKELTDERTENSNTYLMSDGSKQAEIFTENIRFRKEGELIDYDSTLTKLDRNDKEILDKKTSENTNDYLFANESGDSKQYFPKELNKDTGIVLNRGKYVATMIPDLEEEQSYIPDRESNMVTYVSDEKEVSYQYISMKDGVKENIILDSKPDKYTFEYKIEMKNAYLKQRKNDRGILVCDNGTDKVVGYITPPNITDGDGNIDYENVEYSLTKKNNETVIMLSVNETYFENEDLKYPVMIDPTMRWMSNHLTTTGVWSVPFMADSTISQNPLTVSNYLINSYPYNSENRIYLDTSNLLSGNAFVGDKASLKGKYIESAEITMSEAEKPSHYPTGTVQIKRALGEWDPQTITWNTQPDVSEDYIAETVCTGKEGNRHTLDITDWVQDIADEKYEDHGLVFTCPSKGMSAILYGPEFKYMADENGNMRIPLYMTIVVNYREMEAYDASVELTAEYNEETEKVETTIQDDNEPEEGVSVKGYKIFARKNGTDKFASIYEGTDINETESLSVEGVENVDLRVCILYSDGTVRGSNIVTLNKCIDENDSNNVTYEQFTIDTDGDGLPDGYEVFTIGTDPAVPSTKDENGNEIDSDGDGWSDLKEFQEKTDPWLTDSDFDGTNDKGDSSPRKTLGHTRQTEAAAAQVHKGLYDREYSEIEDGVTYTYITNVYRGEDKQIKIDYGDISLNKIIKYFYDEEGNNTAIIEAYDENYDPKNTKTICITYTYNTNGNVTFICDQSTKYTMTYTNGDMTELKVGNNSLVQYGKNTITDNAGTDGDTSNIEEGEIISVKESTTAYGNNQSIKTKTTTYKRTAENEISVAVKDEIYYNENSNASYIIEYNNAGQILKLTDRTDDSGDIVYNYSYTDNVTKVTRNDGFTKEVTTSENEGGDVSTTSRSYTFKDLKNNDTIYTSVNRTDTSDESKMIVSNTLFNGDKYTIETAKDGKNISTSLYSELYGKNVLMTMEKERSSIKKTFDVDIYAEDKSYEYNYDLAGNITSIKEGGKLLYEYTYDAHGRLTGQKDFTIDECHEYIYNTTGNIQANWKYPLDEGGNKISEEGTVKYSTYENEQWQDQISSYGGQNIIYDGLGNPTKYWNGMNFQWTEGRHLAKISIDENSDVTYKYNEDGLRTYKETGTQLINYQWDENNLIRETVTYKSTGKSYDIWYFFDGNGQVAGFEYAEIFDMNDSLKKNRVYYEKNLQGDVVGLLDSRGAEIAKYSYDAWGNITNKMCYEGYEIPYALNHINYRGYYRDDESGFYYLQSRYYDAEIGRFLNADDTNLEELNNGNIFYANIYIYCANNPCTYIDQDGKLIVVNPKIPVKVLKHSVWLAASSFLTFKGYNLSKAMFKHALYGGGKGLSNKTKGIAIKKMKKSFAFTKYMSNCLNLLQKKGYKNVYFVKNSYEFSSDRDLYYSLQHVKVVVHAIEQKGNLWKTEINVSDVYDFTEVRSWSSFAGIANNVGYYLQKCGELKPYKVNIKYNDVHSSKFNIV